MATSLIRGRYVICEAGTGPSASRVITDGAVLQRDGVIEAVGGYDELKDRPVDEVIGGPGFLVMPGMTNAHHHGRGVSTFQMGTVDGCLETWIVEGWGRRPVDWRLITLYTAIQMIKSGTTTVMYNHPRTPTSGMVEECEEVYCGASAAPVCAPPSPSTTAARTASSITTTRPSYPACPPTWRQLSGNTWV